LEKYKAAQTSLTAELNSTKSDRDLLRGELTKTIAARKTQESTIKEFNENVNRTVDALNSRLAEQQKLLGNRDEEIRQLKTEINALTTQAAERGPAKDLASDSVHEEPAERASIEAQREMMKEMRALKNSLQEKEDLLKSYDQRIERLESELKEKRTALAKYEVGAWQAYERRVVWKQRLAKFGISIKDREL
jgi:chromosome segregation ATPase